MAGSITAHPAGGVHDAGAEASYVVGGTGTSNDGKIVRAVLTLDPATGEPAAGDAGGASPTYTPAAPLPVQLFASDASDTSDKITALLALFQNGTAQVSIRRLTGTEDTLRSVPGQAGTATLSSVASSAISVTIKAANAAVVGTSMGRMGLIVVNESTASLYLAYAATASLTAYTYKVLPGQTFEMPSPLYSGLVSGIWDAVNGSARVTELAA